MLGCGGTASVYLAEHIKLNSYRAIKFISRNNPLYELYRKEAYILKNLKHSCIPIIYDIEENEEGSYIVEEYIEGVTLRKFVSNSGALREDIATDVALQLCDLIIYLNSAQRSVLYPDLKPDNIILSNMTIKLIDFGSAMLLDEARDGGGYTGTRGYAAPELYSQGRIDERCEVYGIGMLLYYMLTGIVINGDMEYAENIDHTGSCSRRLKRIINKCLKFNPSQRYSGVELLHKELSALRKSQVHYFPKKAITIAVAGAQSRIGVTHLAFRICSYYRDINYKCLYVEKNASGCIRTIKNRYYGGIADKGIFMLKGVALQTYGMQQPDTEDYQTVVLDYGILTEDNLEQFLTADIKLLLLGAKDWELDCSERVLKLTAGSGDIIYLFNFMNGRQFCSAIKNMNNAACFRIPYEPDPFAPVSTKNGLELFEEITALPGKGKGKRTLRLIGGLLQ